jgi:hypothetical protein
MTDLVQVTLEGCSAWEGREFGTNLTEAMVAAIAFSLVPPFVAPSPPRMFSRIAQFALAISAIFWFLAAFGDVGRGLVYPWPMPCEDGRQQQYHTLW